MKWAIIAIAGVLTGGTSAAAEIVAADRDELVRAIAQHLDGDYVDVEVGRRAAKRLRQSHRSGAFNDTDSGKAFAAALTAALRDATADGHLTVEYSEQPLPQEAGDAAFEAQEMERYYGAHVNFGVEKAARLADNIGLLELSVFPPASMGGDVVTAAMQVVAHTDALIIDLRRNGGGSDTVAVLASYFFDSPQPLSGIYDRPKNRTSQAYTLPYVPGARFGRDKPVHILISKRTFSAAEAFAYDMQALRRATIVGEPSGGGAHPFEYRRIHPHFVLWSVTQKSVNPITGGNWQGVGVQPDVRIEPERALDKAVELTLAALGKPKHAAGSAGSAR